MAADKQKQAWLAATALHAYRDTTQVGIHHESRMINAPSGEVVESLLLRDDDGVLVGALTHLNGKVDIRVHPDRLREGIGSALAVEALSRWEFDLEEQNLTPAAIPFVSNLIERGLV